MESTVLAHLAASMIPQKENLATEALAFILNRSPPARTALQRYLSAVVGDVPAIARVLTQQAVGEVSRPDILLFAENGEQHFGYIEVKFWAAFTEAQPVEYVKQLQISGGGVLVILAPERRLVTMRLEVIERLKTADLISNFDDRTISADSVRLGLLSWTKLLTLLSDAVSDDRPAKSDLDQLVGLVTRVDDEEFMPLMRAELDDRGISRRIISLADLANTIVEKAEAEGIISTKTMRGRYAASHGWYKAGRYAKFQNAGFWLGVHHKLWSMFGRTPIWVSFSRGEGRADRLHDIVRAWLNDDRAYSHDGMILIPMMLAVGVEKERVVADAVRQLRELNNVLAISGLPPVHDEAPPES